MTLKPLYCYKNHEVASLAWAIYSAPLMQSLHGISFVGEEWCNDRYHENLEWLLELDSNPSVLQNYLLENTSSLIGKRFEQLLAFWFTYGRSFKLVARNVVLSENGNTRAEIDFIVEDIQDGHTMHFEVACKYYLQLNASRHWCDWPGPNGHDSLLSKLDKLRRQTGIFETDLGRNYLKHEGLKKPDSYAFLKGIFFHHFSSLGSSIAPVGAHKHYNSGWYCHLSDLKQFSGLTEQWIILPVRLKLCPFAFGDDEAEILRGDDLFGACHQQMSKTGKSVMIAQVVPENGRMIEISRGLIILDNYRIRPSG